jgi:hypothetical protein
MKGCKTEGSKCEEECDQGVIWQALSEPYSLLLARFTLCTDPTQSSTQHMENVHHIMFSKEHK